MAFEPPTPSRLKAMAGWAVSRLFNASPSQTMALHKFKDGCEDLSENYPEEQRGAMKADIPVVHVDERVVTQDAERHAHIPVARQDLQKFVERLAIPKSCEEGGEHKISIYTQRCVFCGATYRDIRGRESEFGRQRV